MKPLKMEIKRDQLGGGDAARRTLKQMQERKKHEMHLSELFQCKKCRDAGWVMSDGKAIACDLCAYGQEMEAGRRQALKTYCGVPENMLENCTFDTYRTEGTYQSRDREGALVMAKRSAMQFVKEQGRGEFAWLWLDGGVGVGKTHLSIAVINGFLEDGEVCKFKVVPDMLDQWRASFSNDANGTFDELYQAVAGSRLLVLDDMNPGALTDWATDKLFMLLNDRYNRRMPTVLTTQMIGAGGTYFQANTDRWLAIMSRMMDGSIARCCTMIADDYRLTR